MNFFESYAFYFLVGALIIFIIFAVIVFIVAAGNTSRAEKKIRENMNKEQN